MSIAEDGFSTIVKSPNDTREYRGFVLENGLKIVLVSDPRSEKSAASMDVFVGHMSDPPEVMGLAHFLEHMLFLGTEKYPDESEYSSFISQHSGLNNAYTSHDHTNYHFDIASDYLEPALDRFAQFFLGPLFTESATDREVNAVTSEHEKNIASDIWRFIQLEKSLSDPSHDFCKFGTGNLATLDEIPKSKGISVRDELIKFHEQWYSSDIMALSVLGSQSLDDLQRMVTERFACVQKKGVSPPSWKKHPYHEAGHATKTYVVPIKDLRSLSITFPIPEMQPHYKTSPANYIAHLIGHEGKGSLLSELKAREWVDYLEVGEKFETRGFSVFCVSLGLTEKGMDYVDQIVGLIFQYIELVRREGIQEMIFNQCSEINAMGFKYMDKSKPYKYVTFLSSRLHRYPMSEILTGPNLTDKWDPSLINMVLEHLRPEKIRVYIVAKVFENKATETEKWYGTKYIQEKIDQSLIKEWTESKEICPNLRIPESNVFIATNFNLSERDVRDGRFPCIIRDSSLMRFWFKQDDKFLLPKVKIKLELKTPYANVDPQHVNLTNLFLLLVKDGLNEYTYPASLAGLSYSLKYTRQGITLDFHGFNEKLPILLEEVLRTMTHFKTCEKRFYILREQYERSLRNFRMDQPHDHSIYYNNIILSDKQWLKEDLLEYLSELTVDAVDIFATKVLSKVYVEGLVYGNLTESDAVKLYQTIETALSGCKPLTASEFNKLYERELTLGENSHSVYETTNEYHKSSSIESYYQIGLRDPRSNILMELIAQILSEPCYSILRTKEQLGYLVHSGLRRSLAVQGLRFVIRSERHPRFLDTRIETFLDSMIPFLNEMTEEEFDNHKEALSVKRLEKPKRLSAMTDSYWNEIFRQTYIFDRNVIETNELKTITKDEFLEFFLRNFIAANKSRRKLATHVISMAADGAGKKPDVDMSSKFADQSTSDVRDEPQFIKDIFDFKSRRPLFPQSNYGNDPKSFLSNQNVNAA